MARDVRFALRSLARSPGFTLTAVIALALGIGANTAIFSVVNGVLLRPLAYRDADRLVTILHEDANPVAVANYLDWRDQTRSFKAMAAAEYWSPDLTGGGAPEHLLGLRVTENLLPMLGVAPLLGRVFAPGEDRAGAEHELVLSYRIWLRRFNHDPNIVGKPVILNGESYTVVGVMPSSFRFAPFWATHAELWAPAAFGNRIHDRGGNSLRVFARLRRGVSLDQARAEIATVTARLERQYPGTNRGVVVTPLKEMAVGKVAAPLLMMLGAVGFVLLIACANVAHMLLARTYGRQREIAVRAALGAGRARILRQFLTESLVLAGCGAALGLLLAFWGTAALARLASSYIPRVETVNVDSHALLFLLTVTVLTAAMFGLAPALLVSRGGLNGALNEGGRGGTDGIRGNRLRAFLVASEFALAFILLAGAGLVIRSFIALESIDPGFNPHGVLSMVVSVTGSREAQPGRRAVFYREMLRRIRAMPQIKAAGAINHLPLVGDEWGRSFRIEGRPAPRPGESPTAVYRLVMPGYFETMRLPVRRGRAIGADDDARAPGVVVINERAARVYWPGEDPIGKRISLGANRKDGSPAWLTIAGVVANAKQLDWAADIYPEMYLAALQNKEFLEDAEAHYAYITLVARTAGNAADLAPELKRLVWSFDPNLPISQVVTMDEAVAQANALPRFEMLLTGGFAAVALLLAAMGIYGVMSYAVARRTREIGIRVALGADRGRVLRMVIAQGTLQALGGAAAGFAGALLLSRLIEKILYGVRPADPAAFAAAAAILTLAALAATWLPARRATKIDPATALRSE